jgi:hypothetical protein
MVGISSPQAAFRLRKSLRHQWNDSVLPTLERVFDSMVTGEDVIQIPKIDLHLKIASEEVLLESLPALVEHELADCLRDILSARPGTDLALTGLKRSTAQESGLDRLLFYLRTGLIPWADAHRRASDLAREFKTTCREQQSKLVEILRRQSPMQALFFRILQLLSPSDASTIVPALLEPMSPVWGPGACDLILLLVQEPARFFTRGCQLQVASRFLAECLAAKNKEVPPDFLDLARRELGPSPGNTFERLIYALPKRLAAFPSPEISKEVSKQVPAPKGGRRQARKVPSNRPVDGVPAREKREDWALNVRQAGLILLHPFLARFFESCGVKEVESDQLSSSFLPRAAALLHFLATGQEEIYEYELGFIKILVGLTPDQSLCVCDGLLTKSDYEEATSLLQATITHWNALKNTSVAGLRSSFLSRQGLLRESDQGWRLQIERVGYDVLIDRLPWSISVAKLPWVTRPIYTEW